MRVAFGKLSVLALVAALGVGSVAACSSDAKDVTAENAGTIGLNLDVAPGVAVNVVSYTITGNGITPIVGTIPVSDPGATISALIGGLPAGTGYSIALAAESVDGKVDCAGATTFAVIAGQTTLVTVDLQCTGEVSRGGVQVGATVNNCAEITSYTAAPLQVNVGGVINLTAAATDKDAGSTIAFAWSAASGTFGNAASANTTYTCAQVGPQALTLAVTDAATAACGQTVTFNVTCVSVGCGNGTVNPGETCDDGNTVGGDACPADCTLAVCGDGKIEGAEICDDNNTVNTDNCPNDCTPAVCGDGAVEGGESCDDGNTVSGDACKADCTLPAVCGNGIVEGPDETCEPPNTATCSAICKTISPAVCGNGTVEAGEACELPQAGNCGTSCQSVSNAACLACETNNPDCADLATGCDLLTGVAAAGPAAGVSRKQLCFEAIQCVRSTKCNTSNGGALNCYCGSADPGSCLGGQGTGACKAAIERGLETTNAAVIAGSFGDVSLGAGMAMARAQCDFDNCNTECQ